MQQAASAGILVKTRTKILGKLTLPDYEINFSFLLVVTDRITAIQRCMLEVNIIFLMVLQSVWLTDLQVKIQHSIPHQWKPIRVKQAVPT